MNQLTMIKGEVPQASNTTVRTMGSHTVPTNISSKHQLVGLRLKKQNKSRQANSSIGYFEIDGKAIVPYNIKHYLRVTSSPYGESGRYDLLTVQENKSPTEGRNIARGCSLTDFSCEPNYLPENSISGGFTFEIP